MLDRQQWLLIRKRLYEQLRRQVDLRLGQSQERLAPYIELYEREFKNTWTVSSKQELHKEIHASDLLYIADFHSLRQAQKVQLKLIREAAAQRGVILAVEFVESAHQSHLDAYCSGELSEEAFLEAVEWSVRWGFAWEHYKPILNWARDNGVRVYALNSHHKQRSLSTLKRRDQHAAKLISEILADAGESLVIVLFGELHLAWDHLPKEVAKLSGASRSLRIFQNSESIYFQLAQQGLENEVDYLRVGADSFCVMGVTPWIKWQNYLMFLEQLYDIDIDEDEGIDYTDHVGRMVDIISQALDLPIDIDMLSVYSTTDEGLATRLWESLTLEDESAVKSLITREVSFYIPELQLALLARPTVNHAAFLAGQYSHAQLCERKKAFWHMPTDFLPQIWVQAASYFGAKLINPKRKTPMIFDLKAALQSGAGEDQTKEAMLLALDQKMRDLMFLKHHQRFPSRVEAVYQSSYYSAARLLGGILGEKLYAGYHMEKTSQKVLLSLLKQPLDAEDFTDFYYNMIEQVEPLPVYFLSKTEKL